MRLWIHIADVAAHVRPGARARSRGAARANSTYVPGTVEPMLPHGASDEACSLAPGVDRLAVTAEIELGAEAQPRSSRFYRSLIRSDRRLDYEQLDRVFAGRDSPPEPVAEPWAARARPRGLGRPAPGGELEVDSPSPSSTSTTAGMSSRARGSSRPRRTA